MKLNYKKSLKFVTLLISSLLIASVSAATYMYMYVESGQISITTGGLKWLKGPDANVGTTITGNTVTGLSLNVLNGTEQFFNLTLYVKNTDSGTPHTFSINVTSSTGATSDFDYMYLKLYDNSTNSYKNQINLLTSGSMVSGLTINGNEVWRVSFYTKAKSTVISGTVTFTVKITYT
jgi:hypothetical protein